MALALSQQAHACLEWRPMEKLITFNAVMLKRRPCRLQTVQTVQTAQRVHNRGSQIPPFFLLNPAIPPYFMPESRSRPIFNEIFCLIIEIDVM